MCRKQHLYPYRLGPRLQAMGRRVKLRHRQLLNTQEERDKVLLTLAVITALEQDFQSCGTLWGRLVEKADICL